MTYIEKACGPRLNTTFQDLFKSIKAEYKDFNTCYYCVFDDKTALRFSFKKVIKGDFEEWGLVFYKNDVYHRENNLPVFIDFIYSNSHN